MITNERWFKALSWEESRVASEARRSHRLSEDKDAAAEFGGGWALALKVLSGFLPPPLPQWV